MIIVPSGDTRYGIDFYQAQLEVTSACNFQCIHCRIGDQGNLFVSDSVVDNFFKFISRNKSDSFELAISGGEPLLHPKLGDILDKAQKSGVNNIAITTNGLLLSEKLLDFLRSMDFMSVAISISLDSHDEYIHNTIRGNGEAYAGAMRALDLLALDKYEGIIGSCIRTTVLNGYPYSLEDTVRLAVGKKSSRIVFSSVYPAGCAVGDSDIMMDKAKKKQFILDVMRLKIKYDGIICVDVHDPLRCLASGYSDVHMNNVIAIGGCPAGTVSFNVKPDGTVTPCAMLDEPIMSFCKDNDDYESIYANSELVRRLVTREFQGICSGCCNRYVCGGCRARAQAAHGDCLCSDPDCWMGEGCISGSYKSSN